MAIADADLRFISVDVGAHGAEGDAGIFSMTTLGEKIIRDELVLPEDAVLGSTKMPFCFVGDDAFPLCKRIMKPFTPTKNKPLSQQETIFNYRLSRARKCVESAFGKLVAKWQCLGRTMFCLPDRAQKIVSACCILHNLLSEEPTISEHSQCDHYDENGQFIEGEWRLVQSSSQAETLPRYTKDPKTIRENFKQYVNSARGSLKWQKKSVFIE